MIKIESWKAEFDSKYEELISTGDIRIIDITNDILLKALDELNELRKREGFK